MPSWLALILWGEQWHRVCPHLRVHWWMTMDGHETTLFIWPWKHTWLTDRRQTVRVCACVCLCVCERERMCVWERERNRKRRERLCVCVARFWNANQVTEHIYMAKATLPNSIVELNTHINTIINILCKVGITSESLAAINHHGFISVFLHIYVQSLSLFWHFPFTSNYGQLSVAIWSTIYIPPSTGGNIIKIRYF